MRSRLSPPSDQLTIISRDFTYRTVQFCGTTSQGHVAALNYLAKKGGLLTVNLGTGRGYSVFDMLRAFERACGRPVPYSIVGRRAGDIAQCWADPQRAKVMLDWTAKRDLDVMCADAWRWQNTSSAQAR